MSKGLIHAGEDTNELVTVVIGEFHKEFMDLSYAIKYLVEDGFKYVDGRIVKGADFALIFDADDRKVEIGSFANWFKTP